MTSTTPEWRDQQQANPVVFEAPPNDEKLASNVAKLESDLAKEREERAEEHFLWIAAVAVLFNFVGYALIKDVVAFIPMFLLELILLTVVARRLGVDWAVRLIGGLMHMLYKRLETPDKADGGLKKE